MRTKISSLDIRLFKGFKNTKIEFSPGLNLLVGSNNSGKSSILQAIHLAFYFLRLTNGISQIDVKRGMKDRLRGMTVKSIPLPFHEEAYIAEGLKKRSKRDQATKIGVTLKNQIEFLETITFPGGNILIISSNKDGVSGKSSYRKEVSKLVADDKNMPLYIPTFSGVATKEEMKMAAVVKHYISLGRSSEVLRNQLQVIKKNNKLEKLNNYLKSSFGVEIQSNTKREIYLSSLYKDNEYDNLDISSAGSGFQQILQILLYIVTSNASVILIDEPDAHLHYKLQNILFDILLEMVADGKQIIIATHSQVFIRRAIQHIDRLILVNRSLQEQKSVEEYDEGMKILYQEGIIDETEATQGGSLKLIDIEDAENGIGFTVLKEWLRRLRIREPQFRIISTGEQIFDYIAGRKKADKISLKSLVLRDSDSLPEEYLKIIEADVSKGSMALVFWRAHEIENFLLNAKVIARFLKSKGIKNISTLKIKQMIEGVVKDNRDKLMDRLDSVLIDKLQKNHRILKLEYGRLDQERLKIRNQIRDNFASYPFIFWPGKEIFGLLKQKIHKEYQVVISELEIANAFKITEIPKEIKDAIKFMQSE